MFPNVRGRPELNLQYPWLVERRANQAPQWTPEQLPLRLFTIGEVTHTVELPAAAILAHVEDPDDPAIDDLVLYGVDFSVSVESRMQYQIYKIMQVVPDDKIASYEVPNARVHQSDIRGTKLVHLNNAADFRFQVQYTSRYIVFLTLRNQEKDGSVFVARGSPPVYELCSHIYFETTDRGGWLNVRFRPSLVVFDPDTNHIVCQAWHIDGKLITKEVVVDVFAGSPEDMLSMVEVGPDVEVNPDGSIGHKLGHNVFVNGTAVVDHMTTRDFVAIVDDDPPATEQEIPMGSPHSVDDMPARVFYDTHGRVFGMMWYYLGTLRRKFYRRPESVDQGPPRRATTEAIAGPREPRENERPPVVFFQYAGDTDTMPKYRVEAWVNTQSRLQPAPEYAERVRALCPEARRQQRTPSVFIFQNPGDGSPSEEWPIALKLWMKDNEPWSPDANSGRFASMRDTDSADEILNALYETYNVERFYVDVPGTISSRQWIRLADYHRMWERYPHGLPLVEEFDDDDETPHANIRFFNQPVFFNLNMVVTLVHDRLALFPVDTEDNVDTSPFELAVGVHDQLDTIARRLPERPRVPSEIAYYAKTADSAGMQADSDMFSHVLAVIWIDAPNTREEHEIQTEDIGSLAHLETPARMAAEFANDPDGRGFYNESLFAEYWCHDSSYVPLATGNIYTRAKRNPDEDHDVGDTDPLFSVMIYQAYQFSDDPKTYRLPGRLQVETPSAGLFIERHKKAFALYNASEEGQRMVAPQQIEYLPFMRSNGPPDVMEHTRTCEIHINTTNGAGNMAIRTKTTLLAGFQNVSPEAIRLGDNASALADHLCAVTVMTVNHRSRTGAPHDRYASVMTRTLDPAKWAQTLRLPREAFLHAVEPFVTHRGRSARTTSFPTDVWTPFEELGLRVGKFYSAPTGAATIIESAHTVTRLRLNDVVSHGTLPAAEGARQFWRDPTSPTNVRNAAFVSPFSSDVRVDQKIVALLSQISVAWRDHLLRNGTLAQRDLVKAKVVE